MITLTTLYIIILICCILCLRYYAKNEMFESAKMLYWFIFASLIPCINFIALLFFIIVIIVNIVYEVDKHCDVDNYAKKLFHVEEKKDDVNNFKGKGYS